MGIEKYIGQQVEVVYQDRKGAITQRVVNIGSVRGDEVYVLDLAKREPRKLSAARILAAMPARRRIP